MHDKSLLTFIQDKLEAGASHEEIKKYLRTAGFTEDHIEGALQEVKALLTGVYNDTIAGHAFIPHLKEKKVVEPKKKPHKSDHISQISKKREWHTFVRSLLKDSMFEGRLGRRDFIMGFLFFFGLCVLWTFFLLWAISLTNEVFLQNTANLIQNDAPGTWRILLPIISAPFTFIILALAARRLHDIDLPGSFALIFLSYFLPGAETGMFHYLELIALNFMATVLFVVLLTKPGISHANFYGDKPQTRGSFFARIFKNL